MLAELQAQPARSRAWLAMLIIVAAGLVAYHNSFRGVFVFDDTDAIVENPHVRHLWPLTEAMSAPPQSSVAGRPMVSLSLALCYAISGLNPWFYHAFNLATHLAAGLLFFGIVRRTLIGPRLGQRCANRAVSFAAGVALLWVVHPLQTESVTYVVQRAEAMVGLCYLLTMYAFIRSAASPHAVAWRVAAVLACAVGMATKEVMATAPLAVLLYDRSFVADSFTQALRRRAWFYVALAGTWAILAAFVAAGPRSHSAGFGLEQLTAWQYALTQPSVVLHYLRLCFWPHPLCIDYGWPIAPSIVAVAPSIIVVVVLLVAVVWALWLRSPAGFTAVCFFLILAPTSSFVPIGDLAVEHRMYLPLAAICTLVVLAGNAALDALLQPRRARYAVKIGVVAVAAAVLTALTIDRNRDYRSGISFWSQTARVSPNRARVHVQLGRELQAEGRVAEADKEYTTALQLNPDHPETHKLLGMLRASQGRPDDAIRHYQAVLRQQPGVAEVHNNLGVLLAGKGAIDEAVRHLREAVRLKPDLADTQQNLGALLVQRGELSEAVSPLQEAARLLPNDADAHCQLARAYARLGRLRDAVSEYDAALRLQPTRDDIRRERDAAISPQTTP